MQHNSLPCALQRSGFVHGKVDRRCELARQNRVQDALEQLLEVCSWLQTDQQMCIVSANRAEATRTSCWSMLFNAVPTTDMVSEG